LVLLIITGKVYDRPSESWRGERASSEREVFNHGAFGSSLVIVINDLMKSRSTSYNIQVLTVERTFIYIVNMPVNYSPTMKGNKELGPE
jgi:hypothetical protein